MKKNQSVETEPITFESLVEQAVLRIHSGLLTDGGKGLKTEVYTWMAKAILWSQQQNKPKGKR